MSSVDKPHALLLVQDRNRAPVLAVRWSHDFIGSLHIEGPEGKVRARSWNHAGWRGGAPDSDLGQPGVTPMLTPKPREKLWPMSHSRMWSKGAVPSLVIRSGGPGHQVSIGLRARNSSSTEPPRGRKCGQSFLCRDP